MDLRSRTRPSDTSGPTESTPTLAEGARAAIPPSPLSDPILPGATLPTEPSGQQAAGAALFDQDVERNRAFFQRLTFVAPASTLVFAWGRGDPTAKVIVLATTSLLTLMSAWYARSLRDKSWFSERKMVAVHAVSIAAALAVIYYCGVLSIATVLLIFGPLLMVGTSRLVANRLFFCGAAGYALLAACVLSGVLPDVGVIGVRLRDAPVRFVAPVALELVLVSTFLLVRAQRAMALQSIAGHLAAARSLAQREALLLEARQELERALNRAGLGRFSDATFGSYRLGKMIGRGAMGEVYEAVHTTTSAPAAVKLLQVTGLGDADMVKRFLREAQIAASLDVPNVVRVLEIGGLAAMLPYIAMERLSGEDLSDHLRRTGPMSLEQVIRLVRQVGRGLEAAHAGGIVHRDLKPRNIFVVDGREGPTFKILDFGVSKLADAPEGTLTHGFVGTPTYMAPEQAIGRDVTHRADLFSLGVITYRALTGRPPFTGENVPETIYRIMTAMPLRPGELVRVHPHVDLVLAIALAKAKESRFDSGRDFAQALEDARAGKLSGPLVVRATKLLAELPWSRLDLPFGAR
jgi:eukaryotic-like serine/threonine-protein kinase